MSFANIDDELSIATLTVAAPNVGLVRLGILLCRLPSCQGPFQSPTNKRPSDLLQKPINSFAGGPSARDLSLATRHPSGDECSGPNDLIYRDHDPERLRELAPTIPFELVEEFIIVGTLDRVGKWDRNRRRLDEINSNTGQLVALVATLGELR